MLVLVLLAAWAGVNWGYQVIRKPTELFFPVSGAFDKMPAETWRQYGALFREYSTHAITPELLAKVRLRDASQKRRALRDWQVIFRVNRSKPGGQHFG